MANRENLRTIGGTVLNVYKEMGETPRERLERLRKQRPYLEAEVLSYAGRLDPMAEGVLLCLVGSANKRILRVERRGSACFESSEVTNRGQETVRQIAADE